VYLQSGKLPVIMAEYFDDWKKICMGN
jgi:hypothetical protein